jgi:hypothetical protein
MLRTLTTAYALARKAGIEVAVVPETHSFDGFDLLLLPSTQKLLSPTWERLARRAEAGALVYWSYFGGDYDFHQGMWCRDFEGLTGCRHQLRYGVPDLPAEMVTLSAEGLQIRARTAVGGPFARAYLPVEPIAAEVLARDQAGRPAITHRALGRGAVIFCAYPWEHYLGGEAVPADDRSQLLYRSLAARARLPMPYVAGCEDGSVQTHHLRLPKEDLVFAANRSFETASAKVDAPGGDGAYNPKEIRILRVPR